MSTPIILRVGEHHFGPLPIDDALRRAHPEAAGKFDALPDGVLVDRRMPEGDAVILRAEKRGDAVHVETGYFVGLFWAVPGVLALHVLPKVDREDAVADMLGMLRDALTDDVNSEHLGGLLDVDFQAPEIRIDGDDHGLRLFLATQYLSLIDQILRGGLMRGFHAEEETFKGKVKGRILLSRTLMNPGLLAKRAQGSAALLAGVHCRHQVFDFETTENRLLKAGLRRWMAMLEELSGAVWAAQDRDELARMERRAQRFLRKMAAVADADADALGVTPAEAARRLRPGHPLYAAYKAALLAADQMKKMEGLGVAKTGGPMPAVTVPPYAVNMAQLFELYVYAKLREALGPEGRVAYHEKFHYQEPDFLCRAAPTADGSNGLGAPYAYFVADAKYKPHYATAGIGMDDGRQLSGYARLDSLLAKLESWGRPQDAGLLSCLIIHPVADPDHAPDGILWDRVRESRAWRGFGVVGVYLPMKRLRR